MSEIYECAGQERLHPHPIWSLFCRRWTLANQAADPDHPHCMTLADITSQEAVVQRRLVARNGCCDIGCRPDHLTQNNRGETVCRFTWWPCPQSRLSLIVQLYSTINSRRTDP